MYLSDWILLLDHIYVALTQVLNFLAKLVIEEQRCGNAAVSRLAHRYDHPGTDAGQQEGQDAVQQEGDVIELSYSYSVCLGLFLK